MLPGSKFFDLLNRVVGMDVDVKRGCIDCDLLSHLLVGYLNVDATGLVWWFFNFFLLFALLFKFNHLMIDPYLFMRGVGVEHNSALQLGAKSMRMLV